MDTTNSTPIVPASKPRYLLANVDMRQVLQRYEHGERITDIAAQLGCAERSLYQQLVRQVPDEWQSIQAAQMISELDRWHAAIDTASDMLELNRAREGLRSAQWQLERLCKRLYGNQPEPVATSTIAIQINLGGYQSKTVESDG